MQTVANWWIKAARSRRGKKSYNCKQGFWNTMFEHSKEGGVTNQYLFIVNMNVVFNMAMTQLCQNIPSLLRWFFVTEVSSNGN